MGHGKETKACVSCPSVTPGGNGPHLRSSGSPTLGGPGGVVPGPLLAQGDACTHSPWGWCLMVCVPRSPLTPGASGSQGPVPSEGHAGAHALLSQPCRGRWRTSPRGALLSAGETPWMKEVRGASLHGNPLSSDGELRNRGVSYSDPILVSPLRAPGTHPHFFELCRLVGSAVRERSMYGRK